MSLSARLQSIAAAQPDAPCLLGPEGLSWRQTADRVEAIAAHLAPERGRVVALAMPEGPDCLMAILGAWAAGAIAFPIGGGATPHERERLLSGLDVAALWTALPDVPPAAPPAASPDPSALALLVATSGSTGAPKRVALSHAAVRWNAEAHAESVGLAPGTRTLLLSSLVHAFPLVAVAAGTLAVGGALSWLPGPFTPRALLRHSEAEGIGYVALTPTLLRLLIARAAPESLLPAVLSVGAGPIEAGALAEAARWAAARGCRLYHTYGLSEAGPRVSTLAPEAIPEAADSVGRPLPGVTVKIMHEGREVPAGTSGEVWLQSPSLMAGYYPEGGGLTPDGWLATGDLGTVDARGFLRLSGRIKDVIVTGGTTIGASEIESALLLDARVAEAAVVAQPDADYGEVAIAFVTLAAAASPTELMTALAAVLSRHKLPRRIAIVDQLPRTTLGKINKHRLKEAACAGSL